MGGVRRLAIFLSIWICPLSTTFRLLKVLQAADFVYQDSQLGWWHIGLGVFNVGAAYIHNRDVLSVAGPFMRRLMLLSGETVMSRFVTAMKQY
ncbi:negative regulator of allantoin and glyoxylate utilization operons [Escherichia coli]|uniref:Negative regulator of allantoin and glyoxylate utilization operons n=1 Tax=Escherichia coli TaxID=562 RepID=A0A447XB87_ECOLX|nr:negative regulator of allantoin and glyoxylate utilization operons [Escherichia coli]